MLVSRVVFRFPRVTVYQVQKISLGHSLPGAEDSPHSPCIRTKTHSSRKTTNIPSRTSQFHKISFDIDLWVPNFKGVHCSRLTTEAAPQHPLGPCVSCRDAGRAGEVVFRCFLGEIQCSLNILRLAGWTIIVWAILSFSDVKHFKREAAGT